jgi:hypothetical protein
VEAVTFTSAHQQVLLETQQAKLAPQASQVFLTDAPLVDRALGWLVLTAIVPMLHHPAACGPTARGSETEMKRIALKNAGLR